MCEAIELKLGKPAQGYLLRQIYLVRCTISARRSTLYFGRNVQGDLPCSLVDIRKPIYLAANRIANIR